MATTYWVGNARATAQVETATVTAVAVGGTLTATINGKAVTYTCVTGDTITSATAAWLALLSSSTAPAEFREEAWASPTTSTITATANTPGSPFAGMTGGLVLSGAGGATVTQATTTASSSPSDVGNAQNWRRGGAASLPQNGDDVVLADSSVPLLWNLAALAAVQFATLTRWQSFAATVGLPENNPSGYYEYRPTYFAFTGPPAGTLVITLGRGSVGAGPTRERYDVGGQQTNLVVLGSGSAADDAAVRFLGTNVNNTISLVGASLAVATLPAEVSTVASAVVDGGGALYLGPLVTFSGSLVVRDAAAFLDCAPLSVSIQNGAQLTVTAATLTYAALTAENNSYVTWASGSTVTALTLKDSTTFDKSGDVRPMVITNSTIDGDCSVLDPNNAITWTNATTVNGPVSSGPFQFGSGRTLKLT